MQQESRFIRQVLAESRFIWQVLAGRGSWAVVAGAGLGMVIGGALNLVFGVPGTRASTPRPGGSR